MRAGGTRELLKYALVCGGYSKSSNWLVPEERRNVSLPVLRSVSPEPAQGGRQISFIYRTRPGIPWQQPENNFYLIYCHDHDVMDLTFPSCTELSRL